MGELLVISIGIFRIPCYDKKYFADSEGRNGCFLPALWRRFSSLRNIIVCGFGISLTIEVLQIFTYRLTDIDDLITNTIGTIVGYYIAGFKAQLSVPGEDDDSRMELPILVAVVFLIMFLMQPFIAEALWSFVL